MNAAFPNQYDAENARALCKYSAETYELSAEKRFLIGNETTDTCVVVTGVGDDVVIAFRGTRSARNWVTDLDCAFKTAAETEGAYRLHAGFAAALDSILVELNAGVFTSGWQKRKVWITGHSLGGALAKLYAFHYAQHDSLSFPTLQGVYTFGQPRVGDADFCQVYDSLLKSRTFRVIHADDVVPRVPWLLGSYRHAAHEVFYPDRVVTADGPIIDCSVPRKFAHDIPCLLCELRHGKLALLDDHHIATYHALFAFQGSAGVSPVAAGVPPAALVPVNSQN